MVAVPPAVWSEMLCKHARPSSGPQEAGTSGGEGILLCQNHHELCNGVPCLLSQHEPPEEFDCFQFHFFYMPRGECSGEG